MNFPFTVEQFMEVFQSYNLAIWPMQIIAYLLGALAVFFSFKESPSSNRGTAAILSLMWLWNGVAYHLAFFTAINKAAYLFGAMFIIQGFLLGVNGVFRPKLEFRYRRDGNAVFGAVALIYALVHSCPN